LIVSSNRFGKKDLYIYINKDRNPSTKSTRHVDANVNTRKKNQDHQNSNNEVKDVILKDSNRFGKTC
jgi:hypothetical protein